MAESRRKFLTSIRLYPSDAEYLKVLAAKTDRTVSYYIQKAVSQFVTASKRSEEKNSK
jgi:predicted DNA-binding protein